MKRKMKRGLILLLMFLGVGLIAIGLVELAMTPNALQYCALPGFKQDEGVTLIKKREQVRDSLAEAARGVTFSAVQSAMSLSVLDRSAEATVFAIGEGWFEVYPRFLTAGRRINETELRDGGRVAMMDERLAFQLFGDPLPENPRIDLLGHSYRVVGTVRHAGSLLGGDGVGDQMRHDLYIPLTTALEDGLKPTVEMLSIAPGASTGVEPQFLSAARSAWRSDGAVINLPKEAMRASMLLRIVFLFFGIYVLALLIQYMNAFARWLRSGYREALSHRYFKSIWPRFVGVVLLHILGYAGLIALTALLVVFSAQPITVFTEWVPENIVSWSAITKVFWNLTRDAAAPVRVGSRELRGIAFWGGAVRWGTVLLLIASAVSGSRSVGLKKDNDKPKGENDR